MIAWLEPHQVGLIRAIALASDLAIAGAGSPSRGQTTTVAGMLDCAPVDDLRKELVEPHAQLLLIATPPDLNFASLPPTALKIATLEPIPDSALAPVAGDWTPASTGPKATPVHFIPLNRYTAPFRAAAELLSAFGPIAALTHESFSLPAEGSLGARLFAAMDLIHMLIGEPDTIDAAFVPAPSLGSIPAGPGETLRGLHGTMTANLRFPNQRSAALTLSNQAARWNNTTTLIGPGAAPTQDADGSAHPAIGGGRLRLFDDGFEWLDATGRKLDEMRPKRSRYTPAKSRATGVPPVSTTSTARSRSSRSQSRSQGPAPSEPYSHHCLAAISDSLRRLLADSLFPEPPADITAALALGQTALLSCRTGQPESPATIRRMLNAQ